MRYIYEGVELASGATSDAATIAQTLTVAGATTLGSTLAVSGASTLTGNVTASGNVGVVGNGTVGGTFGVTGTTTLTGILVANNSATFNRNIVTSGITVDVVVKAGADVASYVPAIGDQVILADAGGAARVMVLPKVADVPAGKLYTIMKTDGVVLDTITIDGDGAETINGAANVVLDAQYENVTIMNTGTEWLVLSKIG